MSLISVIMPVYNGAKTIACAIESVLEQTYDNWELIIVNDGSVDQTREIVNKYLDLSDRIILLNQSNNGVSSARNNALNVMNGDFFCFLDADDKLPVNSLQARLDIFRKDDDIYFVDGQVTFMDFDSNKVSRVYKPKKTDSFLKSLVLLDEDVFCGPSIMVKRSVSVKYEFNTSYTHGEDLLFYISLANSGKRGITEEEVLYYRTSNSSAMSNLNGLGNFYGRYLEFVRSNYLESLISQEEYKGLMTRVKKMMRNSYLKKGQVFRSLKWL